MQKNSSQHILNSSSNLLGFCLVVLTSLKITKINEHTFIDEFTGLACFVLVLSSILSFLSIRSNDEKSKSRFEKLAEYIFMTALIVVFIITFLIAFTVMF